MPTLARTVLDTQLGRGRTATKAVTSYQAPSSILNQRVGRARRFATQEYDLERLRAIARAERATLNDVLMAICAGGLRRFLTDLEALPDRPLVAFVPVNVRAEDSYGGGNAVGATLVSLATEVEDPVARLAAIRASSRAAKARMARHERRLRHRLQRAAARSGGPPGGPRDDRHPASRCRRR